MPRGGKRAGAGRPKNQGKYGEPTKPVRIPQSLLDDAHAWIENKGYILPVFSSPVSAGFLSPADDHVDDTLDLNRYVIQQPAATFFVRASGESMRGAGIHNNDLLVVDRSLEARHGSIVIAAVDGDLTVKRLDQRRHLLLPENPDYPPLSLKDRDCVIWGVVTFVIHKTT